MVVKRWFSSRKVTSLSVAAGIGLLFVVSPMSSCAAFQASVPSHYVQRRPTSRMIVLDAISDKNEGDGSSSSNEDLPSDEGQELADQFFKQLKQQQQQQQRRQQEKNEPENENQTLFSSRSPSQERTQQDAISEEVFSIQDTPPTRKFTGASPSLFSSSSSSSGNNDALERERTREFDLVGNFERTLRIQAAVLIASIFFVAYVGLSGGITNGSDRYFGGVDDIGDTEIEFNVQTDDAGQGSRQQYTQESLWL